MFSKKSQYKSLNLARMKDGRDFRIPDSPRVSMAVAVAVTVTVAVIPCFAETIDPIPSVHPPVIIFAISCRSQNAIESDFVSFLLEFIGCCID
jgi:hypothetical protein